MVYLVAELEYPIQYCLGARSVVAVLLAGICEYNSMLSQGCMRKLSAP